MLEHEGSFSRESNSDQLNLLEKALTDPFIERVLQMGRTYNEIFKETGPTEEERHQIIDELDREWGGAYGLPVKLTGYVSVPMKDSEGVQSVFLDSRDVISNGFTIMPEPIIVGGEEIGYFAKVKHHLYAKASDVWGNEDLDGLDPDTHLGVTADIEKSIIEAPIASPDRARAWLAVSCPELMEEVDTRVLNSEGYDGSALLALKKLDINQLADLSDEFTRSCFDIYLNSILELDTITPYALDIDGFGRSADGEDEGQEYIITSQRTLAHIPSVTLQPAFSNSEGDDGAWALAMNTALIPVDKKENLPRFVISVEALRSIASIRDLYYEP